MFKRLCMTFLCSMVLLSNFAFAADAVSLLNSVTLKPTYSGFSPGDKEVQNTLNQIIKPQMTTYDKVKACYDYLINSCSYGRKTKSYQIYNNQLVLDIGKVPITNFNNVEGALRAYEMLKTHVGVCDDYSCAFAALVRAIGLNCYTIAGYTAKANGGMTGHAWCVININGTEYVFDPQIDDNIAKGGTIGYYRFCKTYGEIPGSYDAARISNYFKPF